jgi:hypothetical protein
MVVGVADITGEPPTANDTLIMMGVPPNGVIVTVPEYGVDPAAKEDGSTPICRGKGVLWAPDPALVRIQVAEDATEKLTADELALETVTL